MKVYIKIITIISLLLANMSINAQLGTVLVMNDDTDKLTQTVFVKWFMEQVVCKEGVNIYPSWAKFVTPARRRLAIAYLRRTITVDFIPGGQPTKMQQHFLLT